MCIGSQFEARTPTEHKRHCDLLCGPLKDHHLTVSGVNRESALEGTVHFSVATGLPQDIMHDLLEGEIKALLVHCIGKKHFTACTKFTYKVF